MSEETTPATKTPDELFAEWLQANNFVALALAIAPLGDAVRVENFTPQNWRVAISVVEAKDVVQRNLQR
ncbi:MAG: hypothetical protein E6Q97_38375 [Desulfurellales bacterium]|nr:MAG: hypothetical protein E6Q97_38375 [Desulfurellales bacterium]